MIAIWFYGSCFWLKLLILQCQVVVTRSQSDPKYGGLSDCGYPAIPFNGKISPDVEVFNAGDKLHFHCNRGFVLDGERINYCLGNGIWKEEFSVCRRNLAFEQEVTANSKNVSFSKAVDGKHETCDRVEPVSQQNKTLIIVDLKFPIQDRKFFFSLKMRLNRDFQTLPRFYLEKTIPSKALITDQNALKCSMKYEINSTYMTNTEWKGKCTLDDKDRGGRLVIIEFQTQNVLLLCEIELHIIEGEVLLCGTPDRQFHTDIIGIDVREVVKYACKGGYTYKSGNLTRLCKNGRWTGKAPMCENKIINRTSCANGSNPSIEGIEKSKETDGFLSINFQIAALATSISSLILFASLIIAIAHFRRRISRFKRQNECQSLNREKDVNLRAKLRLPSSPTRTYISSQISNRSTCTDLAIYDDVIYPQLQSESDEMGYLVPNSLKHPRLLTLPTSHPSSAQEDQMRAKTLPIPSPVYLELE